MTATSAVIIIEGVLDEPIWGSAPSIGDLIQAQPNAGQAPTENTVVTLLRDKDSLYVGVVAYDSEPERLLLCSR